MVDTTRQEVEINMARLHSYCKVVAIAGMVFALCLLSVPGGADDLYREKSDTSKMMTKLGRGCVNVLTGWMEIPKNIAKSWKETDPFSGFVVGTVKGIGWGWARTCTGFYDIMTFPFPVPEDYESLIEPAYILPSIWGEPLPYYAE
jgi:putative exosortase-associated protein (TIGR04073 family)